MNVLRDEKKPQILALGRLDWPGRRIEPALGVDRRTVSRYLKSAGIRVRAPRSSRWPREPVSIDSAANAPSGKGLSTGSAAANAASGKGVSTDCAARHWPLNASRAPAASACEPYRELIEDAITRGRNAVAIYQDLVDDHGFAARYASVKRFVRKLCGLETPEARVVIETPPGQQAQVDYGEGPMVRDRIHGTTKRQVLAMFAEEKPHLRELPVEPFRRRHGRARARRTQLSLPPSLPRTPAAATADAAPGRPDHPPALALPRPRLFPQCFPYALLGRLLLRPAPTPGCR